MDWVAIEMPAEVPTHCVVQAAEHFSIPIEILVAVAKQENGKIGKKYKRSHGTYFSLYQISDKWLPALEPWGYTPSLLQHDACANVYAGAYVLAYYQHRENDWSRALGRYNVGSLNTEKRREAASRYVQKVDSHLQAMVSRWNP